MFYNFYLFIFEYNQTNKTDMKISDLITKLESYKEKMGDMRLEFTVSDHYTKGDFRCTKRKGVDFIKSSTLRGKEIAKLDFDLCHQYDEITNICKQPKITYRKELEVYSV